MQSITVKELGRQAGNVDLIDVRMPTEFRQIHAVCARNVPLVALDPHAVMRQRNGSANQPLYIICQGGTRSAQAYQRFIDAGFSNVVNVEGGTQAWAAAGLPVARGRKAMSLQQQMQLTAGTMILIGVALGSRLSPSFYGLSAFVGAGMVFAGATGYCPLSSLIAKMPWNQCKDDSQCCR